MAWRLIILVFLLAGCQAGCSRTTATQGYHDIRADWSFGTLDARLPVGYRASDVAAAAEIALVRMGFSISDRSESDDRARIEARHAGSNIFEKVIVQATPDGRRVRIRITTRPIGDEDRARIVLDEMLVLLGL
jgi:hypothetical protein